MKKFGADLHWQTKFCPYKIVSEKEQELIFCNLKNKNTAANKQFHITKIKPHTMLQSKNKELTETKNNDEIVLFFNQEELSEAPVTHHVNHFNHVVVSPFIDVVFKNSDEESITILESTIDTTKIHAEVNNNKLEIYIEGFKAKVKANSIQSKECYESLNPENKAITVKLIVNYKKIDKIVLVSEEKFVFEDVVSNDTFLLKVVGNAKIVVNELIADEFKLQLFGKNDVEIMKGKTIKQSILTFGENEIRAQKAVSEKTKLISTGENKYKLNISNKLSITVFGRSLLHYVGNPKIFKNITIGNSIIEKIQE